MKKDIPMAFVDFGPCYQPQAIKLKGKEWCDAMIADIHHDDCRREEVRVEMINPTFNPETDQCDDEDYTYYPLKYKMIEKLSEMGIPRSFMYFTYDDEPGEYNRWIDMGIEFGETFEEATKDINVEWDLDELIRKDKEIEERKNLPPIPNVK